MAKATRNLIKVIGYIRVSRVGGRAGNSFISPDEQKRSIEALAAREDLEVVEWIEELDASGGSDKRPGWNRAIAMVGAGDVQGIVVWRLDRFSRNLVHARQAIEKLETVGGKLYSASESADGITRDMLFLIAEYQRKQASDGFATATRNAIERGVYISAKIPFGYRKNEAKKLEPDAETAPLLVELFERRAAGESATSLARWSKANGGPGRSGLNDLFRNPAYLGHARSGDYLNENAHEPLVARELFDRAQAARGVRPNRTGALANRAMLKSLLRCGTCGASMCITWDQAEGLPDGKRKKVGRYACNNRDCDAAATIRQPALDSFVDAFMIEHLESNDAVNEAFAAADRLEEAKALLADAEHAYSKLLADTTVAGIIGDADYYELLGNHKARVEMAREEHASAKNASVAVDGFNGSLREAWPTLNIEAKRTLLHSIFERVVVTPVHGKRGIPVARRVSLIGIGNIALDRAETSSETVLSEASVSF
jgi:site-specific DNA recombinase